MDQAVFTDSAPDFTQNPVKLDYSSNQTEGNDFSHDLASHLGDSDSYIDVVIAAGKEREKANDAKADSIKRIISGEAINDINNQISGLHQQITDKLNAIGTFHEPERGKVDVWQVIGGMLAGLADPRHRAEYASAPYAFQEQQHQEDVAKARQNWEDQLGVSKMQIGGLQQQMSGLEDTRGDLMNQQSKLIQTQETTLSKANATLSARLNARVPNMQAIRLAGDEFSRLLTSTALIPNMQNPCGRTFRQPLTMPQITFVNRLGQL